MATPKFCKHLFPVLSPFLPDMLTVCLSFTLNYDCYTWLRNPFKRQDTFSFQQFWNLCFWDIYMEAEALILWPNDAKSQLIGKEFPDSGKDRRQEEKGMTEDEMVGWHHRLNGYEFEQALGDGEGQGSLACCSPWSPKVGHEWVTGQQPQNP